MLRCCDCCHWSSTIAAPATRAAATTTTTTAAPYAQLSLLLVPLQLANDTRCLCCCCYCCHCCHRICCRWCTTAIAAQSPLPLLPPLLLSCHVDCNGAQHPLPLLSLLSPPVLPLVCTWYCCSASLDTATAVRLHRHTSAQLPLSPVKRSCLLSLLLLVRNLLLLPLVRLRLLPLPLLPVLPLPLLPLMRNLLVGHAAAAAAADAAAIAAASAQPPVRTPIPFLLCYTTQPRS